MGKFKKIIVNYVSLYGKSFAFVWRSCPWLCTVLFCTVPVQALLPSASLSVTNRIISSVQEGAEGQIAPLLAVWCVFFVLNNLMTPLNTFLQGQLTDKLTYYMNFKIMEKSKDIHDISYFENSAFYDKISLLGREASWRPVNFLVFGTSVLSNAILLVSMVALLASYYVWIAVVLFVAMLVQGVISYRIQQQAFETLVSSSEGSRKLSYYSEVTLTAESIKDVRLYNLYTFFEKKYNAAYEEIHAAVQKNRIRQFLVAAAFLVVSGCFGAFCFSTVIDGVVSKTFEIGAILIFTTSILYCVQGITSLVQESSLLYDTLLYMENLFGYLNLRDDSGNGDLPVPDNYREIVFDRLSFTYPNAEKPALSELTFRVKKGEKIAIVGENGAGKSTLVKLLMRLYPTGGNAVMLDDTPIRTLSVTAWQKRFAAVFQDFAKFDLTLAENVMLSDLPDSSSCAATDSPRFADALERGGVNPAEFGVSPEQMLGLKFEDGRELSGGQWQRIALSRAYYADADILVLDEPASALDPRMEKFVFDKFYELSKDKTVFFITHRLASVRRADKILLLQNGKLAGFDSHENLLAHNAYYAELYHMQADLFA